MGRQKRQAAASPAGDVRQRPKSSAGDRPGQWRPPLTTEATARPLCAATGSLPPPWSSPFSWPTSRLGGRLHLGRRCPRDPARTCDPGTDCIEFGSTSAPRSSITPCCTAHSGSQHKLWGDATLGYHLVNILLHAAGSLDGGAGPAPAGGSRGVSGGGHLRPASGARGIGGLDHGAEEHPLGRVLPGRRAGLPAVRPERGSSVVLGGRWGCSCWAC